MLRTAATIKPTCASNSSTVSKMQSTTIRHRLQNCASSSDKFFMLTSSTRIVTTFDTIGIALGKLRGSQ